MTSYNTMPAVCIVHTANAADIPALTARLTPGFVDTATPKLGSPHNSMRLQRSPEGLVVAVFQEIDGCTDYDVLHKILVTQDLCVTYEDVRSLRGVEYNECVPVHIDQVLIVTAMALETLTDTRWGLELPNRAAYTHGLWTHQPSGQLAVYPAGSYKRPPALLASLVVA